MSRFKRLSKVGDNIETALKMIGVTPERVSNFLGKDCRCRERKQRLNQLGAWAERIITGSSNNPTEELDKIVGSGEETKS